MGRTDPIAGMSLGAIVLCVMCNDLTLLNVQAFYHLLAPVIIILAMPVDRLTRGKG